MPCRFMPKLTTSRGIAKPWAEADPGGGVGPETKHRALNRRESTGMMPESKRPSEDRDFRCGRDLMGEELDVRIASGA